MTEPESRTDHQLTDLYKSLSSETSPRELDQKVLELARGQSSRPHRPGWLLPVSLAATVTLAVGLAWKTTTELEMAPVAPGEADSAVITNAAEPVYELESQDLASDADASTSTIIQNDELIEAIGTPPNAEKSFTDRRGEANDVMQAPVDPQELRKAVDEYAGSAESAALRAREMTVEQSNRQLKRAAEAARQSADQPLSTSLPSTLRADDREAATSVHCATHSARQQEWADCIVELRESGDDDAAKAELALWREAFPAAEFPEP